MTFLVLSDGIFMQLLDLFKSIFQFPIYGVDKGIEFSLLAVDTQLMFYNFRIDFLIEFAVVKKHCVHFFELWDYEIALMYDRLHGDAAAYKHLVDCDEFSELFVVDHLFELFYFILKRDH